MARFGVTQKYHPDIKGSLFAGIFLKIFGTVDTSSSHLIFMRTMKNLAFEQVFEAGCGKGKFSFWLAEKRPGAVIDACDLSTENIDLCNEIKDHMNIDNIHFFVQDLVEYESNESYDFIFSNHVLEHIRDNKKVIANLVHSLKPGGYIYIQIPAAEQKRLYFGRKFIKLHEKWAEDEHVGMTLTLDSLSETLENLNCSILQKKYLEGFWGELRFELSEMALRHFNSKTIFAMLYPLLKALGYIDSRACYSSGNGIMVLAQKTAMNNKDSGRTVEG